ncbi:MAG TPA: PilT/PilU family type 4a pilus ATPase [Victivallales bacterium]|nr:PilT/PilU family type 4a pilus ATPase [Victivallales bacterium]
MSYIDDLLNTMLELNASDLFITADKKPIFKVNGEITGYQKHKFATADEVNEFRISNVTDYSEKIFQKSGNIDISLNLSNKLRYRINFFISKSLPGFVARVIPDGDLKFKDLNLHETLAKFADSKSGLIMIVGAAGSGKSTTMAAITNYININYTKHIITVEDPIEYIHTDKKSLITQREIGADVCDFSTALKNIVRESPDVILIGESRDTETISSAISAALTGHLILTSMHTSDVIQCFERIINSYPENAKNKVLLDLSLSLKCIIAQRLVPAKNGKTRVPCFEILNVTPLAAKYIAQGKISDIENIIRLGEGEGMVTFDRSLSRLYKNKIISFDEGINAATNKDEFKLLVEGLERGAETFRKLKYADKEICVDFDMKKLLKSALEHGASDLLLTAGAQPNLRIDGILMSLDTPILRSGDTKKLFFSILSSSQRAVFESNKELDLALILNLDADESEKSYRFMVNGYFQRNSISVSIRIISNIIPEPDQLGLPEALINISDKPYGLILITGPTGHGKSTTMASLIDRINRNKSSHVITIEDPIEYVYSNKKSIIDQREINSDTLSYSNALKYVLRQDPDIILIGEMRDTETIATALTAAETGHLVIATLHTNNAFQSIDRIIDSFSSSHQNQIRMQLAGSLLGVVSQHLIPRADKKGRICAFEVLIGTHAVKSLIRESKIHLLPSTMETGSKDGMMRMDKSIMELLKRKKIEKSDAINLLSDSELIKKLREDDLSKL